MKSILFNFIVKRLKVYFILVLFIIASSCGSSLDLKGWENDFLVSHQTFIPNTYLKIVDDSSDVYLKPLRFLFYDNGMVTSTYCKIDGWPIDSLDRMTKSVSDIGQYFVENDTIYIQTVLLIGANAHMRVVAKYKLINENGFYKLIYYWVNRKSPIKEHNRIFEGKIANNPIVYVKADLVSFPKINSWHFDGNWGKIKSSYTWK